MEESKRFESLPIRTRLSDVEVARFAANRYRFPGVEIKARLFRQYPKGEMASHVMGYIGRINDKDLEQLEANDDSGQLSRFPIHGQDRHRAELRKGAARYHRLRGNGNRCGRPGHQSDIPHSPRSPAII